VTATASYSELTFADRNPIKRFLQRSRLTAALKMAKRPGTNPRTILDFGAGNGELCKLLRSAYPHARILCYEPAPALMREATENLRETRGIELLSRLDGVEAGSVDMVFCLEVFEHLPPKEATEALSRIARVLSDDGYLIVGVPVEIGLPALYKGMFRMGRRYGAFDATIGNILACAMKRPPQARPKSEIGDGLCYYHHHVGFDHRRFKSTMSETFDTKAISATPIPILGKHLNPEIYFLAKKSARPSNPAGLIKNLAVQADNKVIPIVEELSTAALGRHNKAPHGI
jgi:SAM-dependent methyltransferase